MLPINSFALVYSAGSGRSVGTRRGANGGEKPQACACLYPKGLEHAQSCIKIMTGGS